MPRSENEKGMLDASGTVTLIDTYEHILKKYSQGDCKVFDEQYERGEITLQEFVVA